MRAWPLPRTRADQFLYICLAFVAGIALAAFLPPALAAAEGWWFAGLLAAAAGAVWTWRAARARLFFLGLALLCLAGWRYSLTFPAASAEALWRFNGQKVTLSGRVAAEPAMSQADQRLVVEAESLSSPVPGAASGRVLVVAAPSPAYHYGERLKISCKLAAPAPVEDFAYDRYLAKDGIYSLCYQPAIDPSGVALSGRRQRFLSWLLEEKEAMRQRVDRILPAPTANLVNGMVLGDQRGISPEMKEYFSRSGLSHIVAISGMNMTLLSVLLLEALLALTLPRRFALGSAIVLVWLYALLVGAPASAVRAASLSSLFLAATACGRQGDLPRGLALAAAAMLWANPRLLRDDLGFALSFLAFLGVAYFQPFYDRLLARRLDRWPLVRESLALTLAAQTLAWPLLINSFGRFAWLAPLANLLALPLLAPIMAAVLAAWLLAAWPLASGGLLAFAGLLAQGANLVAVWIGRWPGVAPELPGVSLWLAGLYYAWLWRLRPRPPAAAGNDSGPGL